MGDEIPKEFWQGLSVKPVARNVQDLITQLSRLPRDLPVHAAFNQGCKLVVRNVNRADVHLSIEEMS